MHITAPPQESHPLRTYVVDDSVVIRENLIATLEELAPVQVIGTAADETVAIRWLGLRGAEVGLVIVDLFLHEGNGMGVLRALRSRASPYHVVVLSNYATRDIQRRCLALGADRVFDKSRDIDALIQYCIGLAADEDAATTGPVDAPT
jgi:DNA-binding NarL/FixJ family response regulator